jgi:hypothetical protein
VKRILFLIVSSTSHNHGSGINIERCDLNRKLDPLNTWIPDILNLGHDFLFFDGGFEKQQYDSNNKFLHLVESDEYEASGFASRLFLKVQSVFKWVLENKDFDYVYLCDEDIFINTNEFFKLEINKDFHGCNLGGCGFFFNKKAMQSVIDYENKTIVHADIAIFTALGNSDCSRDTNMSMHAPFYVPGELYSTIHYCTGRRSYLYNNLLKNYKENGCTNRKIIMGYPISHCYNPIVTYETSVKRSTISYYDFAYDPYGWEYHLAYSRSSILHPNIFYNFWPYALNSSKYFIVNMEYFLQNYESKEHKENFFNYLSQKCQESLINKNNLFICSQEKQIYDGWKINNNLVDNLDLRFQDLKNWNFYERK